MSDDTPRPADETQPVRPEGEAALPSAPAATPAAAEPASEPAAGRRGFRDRLGAWRRSNGDRTFGLAALIASALAGIIVGGLGVATFHAVADDHDRDRGGWIQRREGDEGPGRGGMHGGPRGVPGQVPPTTPPEGDDNAG